MLIYIFIRHTYEQLTWSLCNNTVILKIPTNYIYLIIYIYFSLQHKMCNTFNHCIFEHAVYTVNKQILYNVK